MSGSVVHRVHVTRRTDFEFDVRFDAVPAAPSLTVDEPTPLGRSAGPNAADLLAAAVGNCLSASLLMCLQKSRAEVRSLSATVTARIERNEKGRLRIAGLDVEIVPELGPEDAAKLERCRGLFEEFCTVTASIRQGIPVDVRVTQPAAAGA
jgi:uncharacterized OsmC-like protein